MGHICEECWKKECGKCHGDAMTHYVCPKCGKESVSACTYIPKYACPTCCEKLGCCEECGSLKIISQERQHEISEEFWSKI